MPSHRTWPQSLSLVAMVLGLPGCAALRQTEFDVVTREPGHRFLGAPKPVQAEAAKDYEFALLSQSAYSKTPAGAQEKVESAEKQLATAALPAAERVSAQAARPKCEASDPDQELARAGWQAWPDFPSVEQGQKFDLYHLRVEVWYRREPAAVAVAFGGTVFNNRNDWLANLRWFLPKWFLADHPDQYSETVQGFAPAFAEAYRAKLAQGGPEWDFLKAAKLYSTGHSLGGGLAQQFAYALPPGADLPRVDHVFAFDPSPVTGFFSVDPALRDANKQDLHIDRIYERGEILALLRSLTSVFVAPSASQPTIRGVRYSLFYPANPISGHSIRELACRLRVASSAPPGAGSPASLPPQAALPR